MTIRKAPLIVLTIVSTGILFALPSSWAGTGTGTCEYGTQSFSPWENWNSDKVDTEEEVSLDWWGDEHGPDEDQGKGGGELTSCPGENYDYVLSGTWTVEGLELGSNAGTFWIYFKETEGEWLCWGGWTATHSELEGSGTISGSAQ